MMYVLRNERDMKIGAAGVVGGMILIVSLSFTPHLILKKNYTKFVKNIRNKIFFK